MSNIIAISYW